MSFMGWQELILVLAIMLFLFGPSRMKDVSRALGEAVREFRRGISETPEKTEDMNEIIIELAEEMGVGMEGKDIRQIVREIERKTNSKGLGSVRKV